MLQGSIEQESKGDWRERAENESWRSKSLPDHPDPPSGRKLSGDQIDDQMTTCPRFMTLNRHDAFPPCLLYLLPADALNLPLPNKFEGSTYHPILQRYSDSRRNINSGNVS